MELAIGRGVVSFEGYFPGGTLSSLPPRVVPLATSELGQQMASLPEEGVGSIERPARPNEVSPAAPEGRYLIILKEEANPAQVAKEHGIEVKEGDILEGVNILVTRMSPDIIERLKKDSRIEFIEEDQGISRNSTPQASVIPAASTPGGPDLKTVGSRIDLLISEDIKPPSKKEVAQPEAPNREEGRYLIGVRGHVNIDELIAEFKLRIERSIRLNGFYAGLTRNMLDRLTKDTRLLLVPFDIDSLATIKGAQKWLTLFYLISKYIPRFRSPQGRAPQPTPIPFPIPIFPPRFPANRPRPNRPVYRPPYSPPPPTQRPAHQKIVLGTQVIPTGVDRIDAELGTKTGKGIGVAILDTGIDPSHPDLSRNVKGGASFVTGEPTIDDLNGHGTHVAGIIAAVDNNIGVRGVAPDAQLYAVKVLGGNGGGTISGVIKGVNYVASNTDKIQLANMSLGASGVNRVESLALQTAIRRATQKGITFIVAAGNEGTANYNTIPAAFPEAITVTALADTDGRPGGHGAASRTGADDSFASFSNYGKADIAAPGVGILSTLPGDGYGVMSGTSQAAPHVTGVAALYLQSHPTARLSEIKNALIESSTRSGLNPYATATQVALHPEPVVTAWV